MDETLLQKISNAQADHEQGLLELVKQFTPLLKKYAYFLNYADAFADLRLEFIELLLNIDIIRFNIYNTPQMLAYINKSIYYAYIKVSKKRYHCLFNETLVPDIREQLDACECDDYQELLLSDLRRFLTDLEYDVIYKHYYLGLTINEIANMKGVSRQTVNQTKNYAIKKLGQALKIE